MSQDASPEPIERWWTAKHYAGLHNTPRRSRETIDKSLNKRKITRPCNCTSAYYRDQYIQQPKGKQCLPAS